MIAIPRYTSYTITTMKSILFANLTEGNKSDAVEHLITDSSPRAHFFLMVTLSILMATFGLLIDNIAVVIGSMLIAPILYPVLSLALGLVMLDPKLIGRSLYTLLRSIFLAIAAAVLVTFIFFGRENGVGEAVLERTVPTVIDFAIAVVAGFAVSFALVKPSLSETLPGIAISVSLIPPLAVTGIGIALFDWHIISQSFLLFLINTAGILLASAAVFFFMNLSVKKRLAESVIKKEDKKIEKEREKASEE